MTRQKEQEDKAEKREKKKRGDRKGESKYSPEIPDGREPSGIPGLPSGDTHQREKETKTEKDIHTTTKMFVKSARI